MVEILIWIVVGAVIKTLIPMPAFDDAVRAGWSKLVTWVKGLRA